MAVIAPDSPQAADSFIRQIESKFGPLQEIPEMGAGREHLAQG